MDENFLHFSAQEWPRRSGGYRHRSYYLFRATVRGRELTAIIVISIATDARYVSARSNARTYATEMVSQLPLYLQLGRFSFLGIHRVTKGTGPNHTAGLIDVHRRSARARAPIYPKYLRRVSATYNVQDVK